MTTPHPRAAQTAGIVMFVTVVTQIVYIVLSGQGIEPNRQAIWSLEVLAFLVMAIAGFALVPARPLVGGAVAVGGIVNVIQAGMGLVMFPPLADAGPVFGAVLAMAFLLYFAGKVAFGAAAVALGAELWRNGRGAMRAAGLVTAIAGFVAIAANGAAIATTADLTMLAGGTGTLATALLAALLLMPSPVEE